MPSNFLISLARLTATTATRWRCLRAAEEQLAGAHHSSSARLQEAEERAALAGPLSLNKLDHSGLNNFGGHTTPSLARLAQKWVIRPRSFQEGQGFFLGKEPPRPNWDSNSVKN